MTGLRGFVQDQEGRRAWKAVKEQAGIDRINYSRMEEYPDEEFLQIYGVLTDEYELEGETLQRQFGKYMFENLVEIYERIYFDDDWSALDLIDNVEETIHQSLKRRRDKEFTPPELETERIDEETIEVYYSSDRQLCEFAKGMLMGVSEYYGVWLDIDEPECMKEGDDVCRLVVSRVE
jgi:predicted hydrocarbon binding protein